MRDAWMVNRLPSLQILDCDRPPQLVTKYACNQAHGAYASNGFLSMLLSCTLATKCHAWESGNVVGRIKMKRDYLQVRQIAIQLYSMVYCCARKSHGN